jgi:WS/DGAT/MGAT family acyltransferase
MYMEPLDRGRPLWELRLIDGLDDGRLAAIVKVHHAIADGPAAVRLLAALFDMTADPAEPVRDRSPSGAMRPRSHATATLSALRGYASAIAAMNRAPATSLNRPVGLGRRLAIVRLSLAEAKVAAHAAGAKVNDVLLTLAAAGVTAILEDRRETVRGGTIVAGVFVGLRQDRVELGNETGVMAVPLPLGEREPQRCLALVAAATAAAKVQQPAAGLAAVTYLVTRAGIGRALYRRQRQVNIFTTNVVGPTTPLSLFGARVRDLTAVTSLGGNVTLSFAALSYADRLNITVVGDATACPEVGAAADAMRRTWEVLRRSASPASG